VSSNDGRRASAERAYPILRGASLATRSARGPRVRKCSRRYPRATELALRIAQHGCPPAARDLRAEDHFHEVARETARPGSAPRASARPSAARGSRSARAPTASSASRSRPPPARTGRCSRRCPGRARRDSRRRSTTEGRGRSRGTAGSSARRCPGSRARRSSGRSPSVRCALGA
jgi:hypothetical protein